jgi:hypothetical protein
MAFSAIVFAQHNFHDVVYLKNGSIIHGTIIEQVPDKSLKIETADRNVFVYQMAEIEKLTKETKNRNDGSAMEGPALKQGFHGNMEMGAAFGAKGGENFYKLNVIREYCFNPYFSFGIGTGWRYYYDLKTPLVPVFAHLRANFIDSNITPYLSFDLGYSFDASEDFTNAGAYFNPTAGVSFKIMDKSLMNIGIGFEMQNMKYYIPGSYGQLIQHTETLGAISLNVGVSF